MAINPDYKNYSSDDLEDVISNIDKERFPQRYNDAVTELHTRTIEKPQTVNNTAKNDEYVPNEVPIL
ncbi:hypothetical protein [Neptunicella marina]|uniref:Uncharacterized protein n=1 Tax=Neptunicella marina TaxID=2125989 RepID=A0A8J6IVF9_9ALTE|nr:hypothetical protein [Neptunicella marina]MBC3766213.1 hypothetical protein [Neptunicella marina]